MIVFVPTRGLSGVCNGGKNSVTEFRDDVT